MSDEEAGEIPEHDPTPGAGARPLSASSSGGGSSYASLANSNPLAQPLKPPGGSANGNRNEGGSHPPPLRHSSGHSQSRIHRGGGRSSFRGGRGSDGRGRGRGSYDDYGGGRGDGARGRGRGGRHSSGRGGQRMLGGRSHSSRSSSVDRFSAGNSSAGNDDSYDAPSRGGGGRGFGGRFDKRRNSLELSGGLSTERDNSYGGRGGGRFHRGGRGRGDLNFALDTPRSGTDVMGDNDTSSYGPESSGAGRTGRGSMRGGGMPIRGGRGYGRGRRRSSFTDMVENRSSSFAGVSDYASIISGEAKRPRQTENEDTTGTKRPRESFGSEGEILPGNNETRTALNVRGGADRLVPSRGREPYSPRNSKDVQIRTVDTSTAVLSTFQSMAGSKPELTSQLPKPPPPKTTSDSVSQEKSLSGRDNPTATTSQQPVPQTDRGSSNHGDAPNSADGGSEQPRSSPNRPDSTQVAHPLNESSTEASSAQRGRDLKQASPPGDTSDIPKESSEPSPQASGRPEGVSLAGIKQDPSGAQAQSTGESEEEATRSSGASNAITAPRPMSYADMAAASPRFSSGREVPSMGRGAFQRGGGRDGAGRGGRELGLDGRGRGDGFGYGGRGDSFGGRGYGGRSSFGRGDMGFRGRGRAPIGDFGAGRMHGRIGGRGRSDFANMARDRGSDLAHGHGPPQFQEEPSMNQRDQQRQSSTIQPNPNPHSRDNSLPTKPNANPPSYSELGTSVPSYSDLGTSRPSYSELGTNRPSYSELGASRPSYSELGASRSSYSELGTNRPSYSELSTSRSSYAELGKSRSSYAELGTSLPSYSELGTSLPSYSDLGRSKQAPSVSVTKTPPRVPTPTPPTPPPTPPPEPSAPSGLVLALTRLADMEAEMECAYAKHMLLKARQKKLRAQYELMENLPVGIEAIQDDLDKFVNAAQESRPEAAAAT
uniref:Uncharacterized protein n=1 Tax=Entomoneis paludosa TaxID=265537 RepID=A0A7S2YEY4_9STRA